MFEGNKNSLEKNLTYFCEEFTYILLLLDIKVSSFKPQKCIFFKPTSRNGTYEVTFSVNIWRPLWAELMWPNVGMGNFNLKNETQ